MEKGIKKELNLVSAERSYNSLKIVAIVAIISVTAVFCVTYIYLNQENKELANRIVYIDSNGIVGTGSVKSMESKDILDIQMKAAIKYAVPYMYSFNSANYDENIEKGLLLFGKSGKEILTNYLNEKVRDKVMRLNLEVECVLSEKDIVLTTKSGVTSATVTFVQTFLNGDIKQSRKCTAEMIIQTSKVSTVNPFGFVIENWVIINEERL